MNHGNGHLNRTASPLKDYKQVEFPLASRGFTWQKGDYDTEQWYPQGISGLVDKQKEYLIVSWYGKGKERSTYGARISIVDISNLKSSPDGKSSISSTDLKYRHILLLGKDEKGKLFAFWDKEIYGRGQNRAGATMHAGGIAVIGKKLHVADSRKGHRCIRVFDLDKVQKMPEDKRLLKKYEYNLIEEYSYKVPITPSFLSYDRGKNQILIGKFNQSPSDSKPNLFMWITPPDPMDVAAHNQKVKDKALPYYRLPNSYKKIQGMVATKATNGKQVLWLSTSYGRDNRSNFYKLYLDNNPKSPTMSTVSMSSSKKYPPGLEDAYLSVKGELWLLTEFPYKLGSYKSIDPNTTKTEVTRRVMFAIPKKQIFPECICK